MYVYRSGSCPLSGRGHELERGLISNLRRFSDFVAAHLHFSLLTPNSSLLGRHKPEDSGPDYLNKKAPNARCFLTDQIRIIFFPAVAAGGDGRSGLRGAGRGVRL